MSSLSRYSKNKVSLGELIYVLGGNAATGGTSPVELDDFVATNTWLSKTTYSDLFNSLSFGPLTTEPVTWTARTSGTTSTISVITYGNSLYVYAGDGGVLATSTDAITWTARTSGTISTIFNLVYGNSTWVYVGYGGVIATSTDAVTWTARTSGTISTINALTYVNGIYVYAGDSGVLVTSTDAITWTARTSGTSSQIFEVTYGNGQYVYVGSTGALATSTDAITWTARTSGTSLIIGALTYGNGIFVYGAQTGVLRTSTDGITWTDRTSGTSAQIFDLIYSGSYYVYVGSTGALATSTDAITWTARTSGTSSLIRKIAYNTITDDYVYAGDGGVLAKATGLKGITSTEFRIVVSPVLKPTNIGSFDVSGNGRYYVKYKTTEYSYLPVGTVLGGSVFTNRYSQKLFGDAYVKSPGIYSQAEYPELYQTLGKFAANVLARSTTPAIFQDLSYANGLFIGVNGTSFYHSTDLKTWTTYTTTTITGSLAKIEYAAGLWVATTGATEEVVTSTNGITWTKSPITIYTSGTTSTIFSVAYGSDGGVGQIWAYAGAGGVLRTSTDRITWTARTSGTTSIIYSIIHGNGVWVYGGVGGVLATSTDAITWTARTSGTTSTINSLAFDSFNNRYVGAGNGGVVIRSIDAVTWTAYTGILSTSDSSSTAKTITLNGSATASTTQSKFGGYSLSLPGTNSSYISAASNVDFSFGTGDFTIEYWIYLETSTTSGTFIDTRAFGDDAGGFSDYFSGTSNVYNIYIYPSTIYTSPSPISTATWTHVAISRQSTSLRVFFNGIQQGSTVTNSTNFSSTNLLIGTNRASGGSTAVGTSFLNRGYVDDVRITKGVARYTANFTAPTAAFPNSVGEGDSNFSNVSLLLHGEPTAGQVSTGTTSTLNTIVYGDLYIYGGVGGVLATSTDAITWTSRTSGTTSSIWALTYAGGIYVYSGVGGVLATSTDGITWTSRTSGTTSTIVTLGHVAGTYAYAGSGGVLATSTDAITWTSRTSGTTSTIWSLRYANNNWVYAGDTGLMGTSTGAITWIPYLGTNTIRALSYGNGLWAYAGDGGNLRTSTNAITWNPQTPGITTTIRDIQFGNSLWVLAGDSGVLRTSTDAVTWTSGSSGTAQAINAVHYDLGVWAYAGNSGVLATSTDAITWTNIASGTSSTINSITYGNGFWAYSGGVGGSVPVFAFSTNSGVTWSATATTAVGITGPILFLKYLNNTFIAGSSTTAEIASTPNLPTPQASSYYNATTQFIVPEVKFDSLASQFVYVKAKS